MAQALPKDTREDIRKLVYLEADKVNYLAQNRTRNGQFMSQLVDDDRIGGILKGYMNVGEVRTYIKDAILNRYAKDKKRDALAKVTSESLLKEFSGEIIRQGVQGGVSFFKSTSTPVQFYVISEGTCLKWETALRKALEYVAKLPEETQAQKPQIGLKCTAARGSITDSDKRQIRDALSEVNVRFYCIEY